MKKKILFYISNLTCGGAERVVSNLANYLVTENYEVYVLTERKDKEEFTLNHGVNRLILEEHLAGNRIGNLRNRFSELRNSFKRINPDIIVSFAGKCNMRALLASIGLRIPVVPSVRSDPKREYAGGAYGMFAKILFRRASGVVFQTKAAAEFFGKSVQKKSIILMNPLNLSYVKEPYPGKKENKIIAAGSLRSVKNHKMLIEAFGIIANKYPEMSVTIYGEGELREELLDRAKALGISDKISLPGIHTQLYNEIDKARIFVLTSDVEGMPNVLIEAMALGMPVIATDCPCGGPRTLIQDGENGLLVPVKEERKLAEALSKILSNETLESKLGNNAAKIIEMVHPDKVNREWKSYLERIMQV